MPLRIAQLSPPWLTVPPKGYGGIEWVVAALADGLAERGHDVTLFAPGGSESKATIVSSFDEAWGTQHVGQAFPEVIQTVECYLQAERFDVIHDHCGTIGPALGAFSKTPVLVTLHGAFVEEMRRIFSLVGPYLKFVAISEKQRGDMAELPYLATIPNGVRLDDYPFVADKGEYLACVGRLSPDKGAELAIEAAHRLGIPIVLAGKVAEPHEKAYLADVVLPALGPNDEYRGEVTHREKWEIYAHARCLLFPVQWAEPFGLVMVEAMACGTPVVAWRNGAVPEVVVDGRTGYIVESVQEMVDAVRRVEEISPSDCRVHVEERFSARAMVDAYEAVYQRMLGDR